MKQPILIFLFILLVSSSNCQSNEPNSKLNFDFENVENGSPTGWSNFGSSSYILALDSTNVISGKYSVSIEFKNGTPNYNAWAFTIPDNYPGKKITLSGYIKTENVEEGYAGLWMRIDPSIAFDNMESNGVKGTKDWTKYEITLDMNPKETQQIVVGGLLVGKGKMWIDDLKVFIDGIDIKATKPFEKRIYAAINDKEFDKGSGITTIKVDKKQVKDLNTLGLIWGFLKYYHPNIAKGDYNWDYELFRILPKLLKSTNQKNRDKILIKWIESFGQFTPNKEKPSLSKNVKLEPDLAWIEKSKFSKELSTLLVKVKNADRTSKHYYIGLQAQIGNPVFNNENAYSSMKYPDAGFRLLTLYRYWNIIQYYFPYKNLIDEDWKNVLNEFIPKFIIAKDEREYTLTVLELIGRVHDTHANIWGENQVLRNYFGERYAPIELTFVEGKPAVTGFYTENLEHVKDLEMGDIITFINNRPVEEIIKERLKYTPASNYPTKLRDIASNLLRTNDSMINVEFIRMDKIENKTLKTYAAQELNTRSKFQRKDTCFRIIDPDIAYLYLGSIKSSYLPSIFEQIKDTKGLIIDLRCYPSEFVVFDLGYYLYSKSREFVKFTNGNIKKAGLFTFTESLEVGEDNKEFYKGKVVILVNENTQSQAEYTTMAFRQAPNAVVLGSTTAGADGNVSQFYLPGGIRTMISGIGVYCPNGMETQRIGIVPDIEITPTIQGIKKGEDELLHRAREVINRQ